MQPSQRSLTILNISRLPASLMSCLNRCLAIHRLAYSTSDPNFKLKLPTADEKVGNRILVSLSDGIISVINDLGADKKYKSKLLIGSCITTAVPIINKFDDSQPNNFGTTKVKIPPGLQMNMKDVEETAILLTKDDGVAGSRKYILSTRSGRFTWSGTS